MRRLPLLLLLALLTGCLQAWPVGDPRPGLRGDDDDAADDDDATVDDDDSGDDDDTTGDDDDTTGDDDDFTGDDDDFTGDDDDSTGDDDDFTGDDDDSTPPPIDADNDSYPVGTDCNDNDPSINPGASDVHCDSIDQDCDGADICDICWNAVPLSASLIPGVNISEPGYLGPPDEIYQPSNGNQYYFIAYEVVLPTIGEVQIQYSSSAYSVWLEQWDAGCSNRLQADGGEFDTSSSMDFFGLGDTVWIVLSSYQPMETGTYTFNVLNTTGS